MVDEPKIPLERQNSTLPESMIRQSEERMAAADASIVDLARALFGLERRKDHRAFGPTYPIAPIYLDLAEELAANSEGRREILRMLGSLDG